MNRILIAMCFAFRSICTFNVSRIDSGQWSVSWCPYTCCRIVGNGIVFQRSTRVVMRSKFFHVGLIFSFALGLFVVLIVRRKL